MSNYRLKLLNGKRALQASVCRIFKRRINMSATMKLLFPRSFLVVLSMIIVLVNNPVWSQPLTIYGRVIASDGTVVTGANMVLIDGTTPLDRIPQPIDLSGQFKLVLNSFNKSHLTCEVRAEGMIPRRITISVQGGSVNLGTVKMTRLRTFTASNLKILTAADSHHHYLDVLLTNETAAEVQVSEIEVVGTGRRLTNCIDYSPSMSINVSEAIVISRELSNPVIKTEVHVPSEQFVDRIQSTGIIEQLPCHQKRIQIQIPLLARFQPRRTEKVRVVIPTVFWQSNKQNIVIDLRLWEMVALRFVLEDKTVVVSTATSSK